jgi:diguanylate cyclase (GGDEF)-like protein/PAS domain S-box-containing protein
MTPAEQINPIAGTGAPRQPWPGGGASGSRVPGSRDAVAIALLTVAAASSLFGLAQPDTPWQDLSYLLVVPLCWTTVRASKPLAAAVFLVVALMGAATTVLGYGPFGAAPWAQAVTQLALMLFLFALIMASTAVLVHDRTRAADALAAANRGLEQLVARRTAALARSEEQFRAIVEIAPLPLMLIRAADRVVLYLNPRAAEMLELSAASATGRPLPDLFVDSTDRDALDYLMRRNGTIREFEVEMKRSGGAAFWGLLSVSSVSYGDEPVLLMGISDITRRRKLEDDLRLRATVDGLTGIANRNHFIDTGDLEVHRARRYGRPLSVVLIDLDHFKQINDTHGHGVGDAVIKSVVRACLGSLRTIDRMGRLGGEEFAALLPETTREGAAIVAERLRAAIAAMAIELDGGAPLMTTASIGVATIADSDATRVDALIARADRALYAAKRAGRNRVMIDG